MQQLLLVRISSKEIHFSVFWRLCFFWNESARFLEQLRIKPKYIHSTFLMLFGYPNDPLYIVYLKLMNHDISKATIVYKFVQCLLFFSVTMRSAIIIYCFLFLEYFLLNRTGYGYCIIHLWQFSFDRYLTFFFSQRKL